MSMQEGLSIRDESQKQTHDSLIIRTLKRIGCTEGLRTLCHKDISLNQIQLW